MKIYIVQEFSREDYDFSTDVKNYGAYVNRDEAIARAKCVFEKLKQTYADNARNRTIQKNNTSKIIGVSLNKDDGLWIARIQVDGDRKYLGCFSNKDDAIKARLKAEVKYYGKFAPQQHLYDQYGITVQN